MDFEKLGTKLKTTNCTHCGKKVEVLEVTGAGSITKYAPCKNCTRENLISTEKWERGPAEIDVLSTSEIIQYIRDLVNLTNLLECRRHNDHCHCTHSEIFNSELLAFIQTLKKAGYSDDRIHQFITYASYNTRYSGGSKGTDLGEEYELGVGKDVPRALPNQGDWREWQKIKRAHK